jgi:asparagine synthase (glutamine-hydrolysing)
MGGRTTSDLAEQMLVAAYRAKPLHMVERLLYTDMASYLPDDLQVKMDMASMAHGLEARSPLLDHQLVEFAARLPVRMKLGGRRSKSLLKQAHRRRFPPGFLDRRKQGFGLPIRHWFRRELSTNLREALGSGLLRELDLIDLDYVDQLIDEHEQGRAQHQHRLWCLLVLARWLDLAPEFRLPQSMGRRSRSGSHTQAQPLPTDGTAE